MFTRHAEAYRDRLAGAFARGEAAGRERVLELLRARPGQRALDLGCGPGVLTLPLAAAVGERGLVAAVDIAEGMVGLVRPAAPARVAVLRMDMQRLGFRDGAFDAVAAGHSLQFCPNLAAALSEAWRVLVGGGGFAASLPAGGAASPATRLLDEVFARRLPRPYELPDGHETREIVRDRDRLRAAVAGAGFRGARVEVVEEVTSYPGPAELVDETMRWWTCAWRLEAVSPATRERLRAETLDVLYERLGTGPLEVPGASWVVSAVR
jgi:SAM-dependent methyltransferase